MARLDCKCGYTMWNGPIPNDIEFTVFSDARLCELEDNPPSFSAEPTNFLTDFIGQADYEIWRCPRCKRLYVFDLQNNSGRAKYVYKLETDNTSAETC